MEGTYRSSLSEGTYKVDGQNLELSYKVVRGEPTEKTVVVTLAADMKSYEYDTGSELGTVKMVKQE